MVAVEVNDVVRVAVNEAYPVAVALTGVYDTVPLIGTFEFRNCTAPLGANPRLVVVTSAVKVTEVPDVVVEGLAETAMVVGA